MDPYRIPAVDDHTPPGPSFFKTLACHALGHRQTVFILDPSVDPDVAIPPYGRACYRSACSRCGLSQAFDASGVPTDCPEGEKLAWSFHAGKRGATVNGVIISPDLWGMFASMSVDGSVLRFHEGRPGSREVRISVPA